MLAGLVIDFVQTTDVLQPVGEIGKVLGAVFALVGSGAGVDVGVLLQLGAAEERFAAVGADVRSLFEVDERVHLEVAFGFVHFRAGLALEGAHADVVLAMAQQLGFADEAGHGGREGGREEKKQSIRICDCIERNSSLNQTNGF